MLASSCGQFFGAHRKRSFPNGYVASIRFDRIEEGIVEVAVFMPNGEFRKFEETGNDVRYMDACEIPAFVRRVASF